MGIKELNKLTQECEAMDQVCKISPPHRPQLSYQWASKGYLIYRPHAIEESVIEYWLISAVNNWLLLLTCKRVSCGVAYTQLHKFLAKVCLENGSRYGQGYYYWLIGSRAWAFDWHQDRWPWMTLNCRKFEFFEISQILARWRRRLL